MRALPLQAFMQLIRHDLFLLRHDFAEIHSKVRLVPVSSRWPERGDTEKICTAVAYACIWYPRPVLCLQRSAVTMLLLRRYGIHAETVIGVQRLPLKAHAWVEVDGHVINDKPEVQLDYLVMERC
jgi:Transglutaminase-like superfamily